MGEKCRRLFCSSEKETESFSLLPRILPLLSLCMDNISHLFSYIYVLYQNLCSLQEERERRSGYLLTCSKFQQNIVFTLISVTNNVFNLRNTDNENLFKECIGKLIKWNAFIYHILYRPIMFQNIQNRHYRRMLYLWICIFG